MYYKLRKTTNGLSSVGFLALASAMGTTVNAEEVILEEPVVSDDTTKAEAVRNYIKQMRQGSSEAPNPYVAEILKKAESVTSDESEVVESEATIAVTSEADIPVTSEADISLTSEAIESAISETDISATSETDISANSETLATSETVTESLVDTSAPTMSESVSVREAENAPIMSESVSVREAENPFDPTGEFILNTVALPEPEDLMSDPQTIDFAVDVPRNTIAIDMRAAINEMLDDEPFSNTDRPAGYRLVFRLTPRAKNMPPKVSVINTTDSSKWNLVQYSVQSTMPLPSDRIMIANPYTVPVLYDSIPSETTELDAQLMQEYAGAITYPSGILQLTVSDLDPTNRTIRHAFSAYGWTDDTEMAKQIIKLNYIEIMHVLLNRYSSEYTQDPYAVFENIYHISTQQFAQIKASKMRVDAAWSMMGITDETTLKYYNDFQKYYKRLETIYNGYNNKSYMPNIRWEKAVNPYDSVSTNELKKFLQALPLQIRQLAVDITVIDESKGPEWAGLAYGTREIALNPLYVNINNVSLIVAHEMGHAVDFASTVYDKNNGYKVVNSFSRSPEFRAVWKRGFANYDAYFKDDPEEGFAEGFAQWLAVEYGGASRTEMERILPGVYDYFQKLGNKIFFTPTSPLRPGLQPSQPTTPAPKVTKEVIPFTTTYVADVTLDVGKTQVRTAGRNGEKVTTTVVIAGIPKQTVTRTEPVNQVVVVGTKPKVVTSSIPFEIRYTQDSSLEANKTRITIPGVNGVKTVTTNYKVINGAAVPLAPVTSITKQPVQQWVSVGVKPIFVTNVLPFKTTYVRDDNAVAGTTRVTREGVNGSETITTTYTLYGSTATPKTTKRTSAPTDKIVSVGTKPTTNTTTVPFTTEYRRDDNLLAGTEKVLVAGQNGTRTVRVTYDLVNGKAVPKENVTSSNVVNKVVAIGTKPVTKTTNVAYKTEYVRDDNLVAGQTRVVKEGVNGVNTIKTTYDIVNGKAVGKDTVTKTNVVNKVVAVGTKPSVIKTNVAFGTDYVRDDNLAVGQTRVVKEGVNSVITRTTTYDIVNGKAVGKENVTKTNAVNKVIAVGTKPVTRTTNVAFGTDYVRDDNLAVGKTRVVKEGVNGTNTIKTTYDIVNGKAVGKDTVTKTNVVNKVIAVGTKPVTKTTNVAFGTDYVRDDNLAVGKTRVVKEGVNGVNTIKTTYDIVNGKAVGKDTVTKTNVVNKVIAVGTKPVTKTTNVAFGTEYVRDDNLAVGQTRVVKEGVNGVNTIKTTYDIVNGKAVGKDTVTKTNVVNKVIAVGTKPVTKTTNVSFGTEYVRDDNLAAGQTRVVKEGVNGVNTIKTTYDIVNGKAVGKDTVTKTNVVNKVIAVGTKPVTKTTNVAFTTEYVRDENMTPGKTRVVKEGVNGTVTTTTTYEIVNGKAVGKDTVTKTNVVNKVIAVGTKPNTTKVTIPFKTIYQRDDNLAAGQTRVIKEGVDGFRETGTRYDLVDGKAIVNQTVNNKPAVDKIVAVGTKPVRTEAVTKRYSTVYVPNYGMAAGETRVKTKGANQSTVTTTTYDVVNGKAVPKVVKSVSTLVNEVVEVGVKSESTITHTDFKTIYVADETLSAGTKKIRTLGYRGYTVTTTTYKIVDGKAVPVVTTKKADPIDEVIVIGTKPRVHVKYIPYRVESVINPNMARGEVKVVQNGTPGEIITTTTYSIVNGQAVGTDVVTTKPAKNYILHTGR